jgi:tetratricopeptide (TPR) repeat protein
MKYFFIFTLLVLSACSSRKSADKMNSGAPKDLTKDSFKKEKVLAQSEVKDYISEQLKSLSPALQDETLDRYSVDELEALSSSSDPLIALSIRCSKNDFEQAFALAGKNFNRYQKIPAYWNLVANCHLNQGSPRKALLFYNKAIEVSPGYVPALNNIGVLYSRQGEDQKALIAFEKANKQSRFSKTPRYNLAKIYLRYGLAELALPLFQGLLNESAGDVELINAVANCYFLMSDYQRALGLFGKLPNSILGRSEYGLNYALALKKTGKAQEAQKMFTGISEPKSKELKEYYAVVAKQLGVQ